MGLPAKRNSLILFHYLFNQSFSAANARDAAMTYVLDKNSTDVTLLKKENGSNDFKSMHTTGTMNSDKKVTNANSTKCK